ncbi:MAG: sortase [Acidimicrobiia bacterium]|nr:sortase [Acidimicrobiia bacterium]
MRVARLLGAIGRFLIGTGVVMLLFVAYQLWGTGLQHAAAQDDLEDDFAELLEVVEPEVAPDQQTSVAAVEGGTVPAVDAELVDDSETDEAPRSVSSVDALADFDPVFLELLYPSNGEVLGRLDIPRIGLEEFFVEGVGVADLRRGPGHYRTSPLPGQAGNAAIAGHRTTYGAPFHRIDELEPGDEINITTLQGDFTYRVMPQTSADGETKGHFIVSPSDTQVLDDFGDDRLTLTACHPKYSARQRIIVVAELVEEPEPTPPRPEVVAAAQAELLASEYDEGDDDEPPVAAVAAGESAIDQTPFSSGEDSFGEGLNGDRDAIPPAVAWMTAAVALWMTAGFLGRRWRLLPTYVLALAPVAALLFMAFIHIDQAIPSY